MKVLKFGGTSVGSVDSILSVKNIVEAIAEPVIVVVSALGGITDKLIETSRLAAKSDEKYRVVLEEMVRRHHDMIEAVIPAGPEREELIWRIDGMLNELRSIYHGVYLIRDLTEKTSCAIVSYGERLSSAIVAALIKGARLYDSRDFIKTERKGNRNVVHFDETNRLVKAALAHIDGVALLPGFISRDVNNDETTNLGRGGSDYTAAIVAAALDAAALEIWTDVDGFMTADPRVIPNAYTINELSYAEAMELCNFGAKVVYPPTIYPVCVKNIPIYIKNTFRPEARGSVICQKASDGRRTVRGISSIRETSMITVSGLSMVGAIGINRRIFTTLADNGISAFMVAQTSSETSTSICVTDADAERARRVLDAEFAKEIANGAIYPTRLEGNLSTVAAVGEGMNSATGVAGKLFGVLGRNGINVIATAQSALETNISFVVRRDLLRKALNVIHDSFFLSEYQVLNLFICGMGTVGSRLIEQIAAQREKLMKERGLQLNVVGMATSHYGLFTRDGIDLSGNFEKQLRQGGPSNVQRLRDEVIGMNIFNSVFVDCTASPEVAGLYADFLDHNISVVAANKIAASSPYENYRHLKQLARDRGVKYLFETNVGAGLPIISTIHDLTGSGDRMLCVEAVLSGTLNYVFNTLSADVPFSRAVRMAKENGYSEPDPRIDLSGKDVVRKLVILVREAGYRLNVEDVKVKNFIPDELFAAPLDEFWNRLPLLDDDFEKQRRRLAEEDRHWRFVAKWQNGVASAGLEAVAPGEPLYRLDGSNNIVLLTTERYKEYPMHIQGYGAGADVTAAGVFADIMRIANL